MVKILISSTCEDLHEERNTIASELRDMGYDVILSEADNILFAPYEHTHSNCIKAVDDVQIVIFLVGYRFGGTAVPSTLKMVDLSSLEKDVDFFKANKSISITQCEVLTAINHNIPVYTFIKRSANVRHEDYEKAKKSGAPLDFLLHHFRDLDEAQYIFEFYNYVRKRKKGNYRQEFDNGIDVANAMKNQLMLWFSKLISERKKSPLLVSDKTEVLPAQVVTHRSTAREKIFSKLYQNLQEGVTVRIMGTGATNFLKNEDQMHAILQDGNNVEILLINNQIIKKNWHCTSDDFVREARETLLQGQETVVNEQFKVFCPLADLNFLIDTKHFNKYHSREDYDKNIEESITLIKRYQEQYIGQPNFGTIIAKHFRSFVPLSITAIHRNEGNDNDLVAEFVLPFSANRIIFHSSHDDNPSVYKLFMDFFESTWKNSVVI